MDWLLLGVEVVILVVLLWVLERQKRIEEQIRKVGISIRVRQSSVSLKQSNRSTPQVDSKARTTKRDTPDIPARGGRMSQAVHRKKYDASQSPDN